MVDVAPNHPTGINALQSQQGKDLGSSSSNILEKVSKHGSKLVPNSKNIEHTECISPESDSSSLHSQSLWLLQNDSLDSNSDQECTWATLSDTSTAIMYRHPQLSVYRTPKSRCAAVLLILSDEFSHCRITNNKKLHKVLWRQCTCEERGRKQALQYRHQQSLFPPHGSKNHCCHVARFRCSPFLRMNLIKIYVLYYQ